MTTQPQSGEATHHVLVTWGSKRGGTEGIARMIAATLQRDGIEASCAPASEVRSLRGYDAAIIGGALYANRWHPDARRFANRQLADLRRIPTWLFSSGPLDDSASHHSIPPTRQVAGLPPRVPRDPPRRFTRAAKRPPLGRAGRPHRAARCLGRV